MAQNLDEMRFCSACKMNVFPTRPKFNVKIFYTCAVAILFVLVIITIISLTIFAELFLFIFFMWGFIMLNPYLIYYGIRRKQYCPRCYQEVSEKNLDYKPFGDKEPEIYKLIAPPKKFINFHCPYCGILLNEGAKFCKLCGKKFEIQR
jgi:hypothetical protein